MKISPEISNLDEALNQYSIKSMRSTRFDWSTKEIKYNNKNIKNVNISFLDESFEKEQMVFVIEFKQQFRSMIFSSLFILVI